MFNWEKSKYYYPFLIIVSLILVIIFYLGIVMKEDTTGRILIGSLWLIVSSGPIIRYIQSKKIKV